MIARITPWAKGALTAMAAMAVFAVSLGCFIALMLLVISMEEGGGNLSSYAVSLTCAVMLLSQGVGFIASPVTLTLVPLLLTLLLVGVVRAFAQRFSTSIAGYCSGLAVWLVMTGLLRHGTAAGLTDDLWVVLAKGAVVFSAGYALAALPASGAAAKAMRALHDVMGPELRRTVRVGLTMGMATLAGYLCAGMVTVIVWSVQNHAAMGRLFSMIGMGTGSRIVTTIACLAWLPNLCIWAMSWVFGGGFAIGDLGSFTLWIGQSSSLPAIPLFGLLPQPVADDRVRMLLMSVPLACGLVSGLIAMWSRRGFAVRAGSPERRLDVRATIVSFAYPAGAFCIAGAMLSVMSSLVFLLSNGGLGEGRLAHLGVDVMQSTQTIARPTAIGLFAAWLLSLIGMAAIFGIRWASRRVRERASAAPAAHDAPADDDRPRAPRTTASMPGRGPQSSQASTQATKEE